MDANDGHSATFSMTVWTKARALLDKIPIHADAELVAELRPDDLKTVLVSYSTLDSIRDFIKTMSPRSLTLLCDEATENPIELRRSLDGDVSITVH